MDDSLTKEILLYLLVGGVITFGISNPALLTSAIFIARYIEKNPKRRDAKGKEKIKGAFYYLKKNKYIQIKNKGGRVVVGLSDAGVRKAKVYRIQSQLMAKRKPYQWSGNWYIVAFDIENNNRIKRDALRRLLTRSGFEQLQKSLWVYPFDCQKEISYIKELFSLHEGECRVLVSKDIGDDSELRKTFGLN